jgi:hypothetical protein
MAKKTINISGPPLMAKKALKISGPPFIASKDRNRIEFLTSWEFIFAVQCV